MTPTTLPDEILKTDALGRVRTPKARREALLAEFERSGVSGKKFATLVGVNYQAFASWVQQWRRQRGADPSAAQGAEVEAGRRGSRSTAGGRWCWRRRCCGRWAGRARRAEFCGRPPGVPGHRALRFAQEPFGRLRALSLSKRLQRAARAGGRTPRRRPARRRVFVFCNRRRTRLKMLYFDGTGLWVLTKRLEKGTFCWPKAAPAGAVKLKLTAEALALLTDGVDLRGAKLRPWYERE